MDKSKLPPMDNHEKSRMAERGGKVWTDYNVIEHKGKKKLVKHKKKSWSKESELKIK